jgi:hypothetical protein
MLALPHDLAALIGQFDELGDDSGVRPAAAFALPRGRCPLPAPVMIARLPSSRLTFRFSPLPNSGSRG